MFQYLVLHYRSTNGILFCFAKYFAISCALYLGDISDLYDESCSSSIIIIPKFSNGANIADLAPITIFALPLLIFFHWSNLSPCESLLCRTAMQSPNLDKNLSTICGVSDISGTNTIAVLLFFNVFSIICMYISVFP